MSTVGISLVGNETSHCDRGDSPVGIFHTDHSNSQRAKISIVPFSPSVVISPSTRARFGNRGYANRANKRSIAYFSPSVVICPNKHAMWKSRLLC